MRITRIDLDKDGLPDKAMVELRLEEILWLYEIARLREGDIPALISSGLRQQIIHRYWPDGLAAAKEYLEGVR